MYDTKITTTSSKGGKVLYTRTSTRSVSPASRLLSAGGGSRGIYTKSRDILTSILGFIIILLLFSHIVSSNALNNQRYELSFGGFLAVLSNPPDFFGRGMPLDIMLNNFRGLVALGDVPIIGVLLESIGTIGYYLFSVIGFLLQGLNMILGVFLWVLGYLCPFLLPSFA